MERSESIKEIAKALAEAQGKIGSAHKDKTAQIKSDKGSYSYKYTDLATVIEAIREPLSAAGIAWVQPMKTTGKQEVCVETVLLHSSGEWISSSTTIPVNTASAQAVGSALTYARRYGLMSLIGVAADDDDGHAANNAAPCEDHIVVPIDEHNAAEQAHVQEAIAKWRPFLDSIQRPQAATAAIREINEDLTGEPAKAVKRLLLDICRERGYRYDAETKAFQETNNEQAVDAR